MTKEEQEAYWAKREQELLDMCRIKTGEQFLEKCQKAGIEEDWYAFICDRSKPVSMDDDTVYYGKSGKTIVSYPFQRWDIAYSELLRYKEEYEWEATGAPYRITSVKWESNADITSHFGNVMTIREVRFSKEVREVLTERLAKNLIEDEYEDLRAFQEDNRNAISAAYDPKLSPDDQKTAFAKASNRSEAGHPAVDNYEGYIVIHNNLHRAYDQAGLEW